MKEDVLILAIESSCDETAAAVVKNGREVLFKCNLFPDCTAYSLRRCCAGDCIKKAYREDKSGRTGGS